MNTTLEFVFSKEAAAIAQKQLLFQNTAECISITLPSNCPVLSATDLYVKNAEGKICFHRQLGTGEQAICITGDPLTSSIGTVPFVFSGGLFCIELVIWSQIKEKLSVPVTIPLTVSDHLQHITQNCTGETWMNLNGDLDGYNPQKANKKHTGWYAGDFHCHTILSDGHETIPSQMCKAELMNLDFYTATEHNLVPATWIHTDLLVLCGTEITTEYGHANLFGLTHRPQNTDRLCSDSIHTEELLASALLEAKKEHAIISINHPFLTPWAWLYKDFSLQDLNCLEIINDPTFPDNHIANMKAILLLDRLWEDGWQICGIGGSDTHALLHEWYTLSSGPSIVGDPTTHVYANGLCQDSVLNGLRKRNVMVTRYMNPHLEMTINGKAILPGTEIREDGILQLRFHGEKIRNRPSFYIVMDGHRTDLSCSYEPDYETVSFTYEMKWDHRTYHWFRIGAENENQDCILYINPVFSNYRKHRYSTFGEIADGLQSDQRNHI